MGISDNWLQKFVRLANEASTWSKDPSTKVACIAFNDNHHVLAVAYNGFVRGADDALERYADRKDKINNIVHAEANIIAQAARVGAPLEGASMLVTALYPCSDCAKLIAQAGITTVYAPKMQLNPRWNEERDIAAKIFLEAGVEVVRYDSGKELPILDPSEHRCHDHQCLVNKYCVRWKERETGDNKTVHATTLRRGWEPFDEYCEKAIPADN